MAEPANPFDMSALPFNQLGPMLESVERFNKTWSSLSGIPSRMLPTVNVEELGQRINELKAVEQWLTLNLNVLRNTIQGMSMQRDALSAVHAFNTSRNEPGADGIQAATSPWAKAAESFKFGTDPATAPPVSADSTPPASPFAGFKNPFEHWRPSDAPAPETAAAPAGANMPPSMNPSVWWTMLQQHFSQVAEAALAGAPRASGAESPPQTAEPSAAAAADAAEDSDPPSDETEADGAARPDTPWGPRAGKPVPPLVRPSRNTPRTSR